MIGHHLEPCGRVECPDYAAYALPALVGAIGREMEARLSFSIVVCYQRMAGTSAEHIGSRLQRDALGLYLHLSEKYAKPVRAVWVNEISARGDPNFHMLVGNINLRKDVPREWGRPLGLYPDTQRVGYPSSLATYLFKIPLMALLEGDRARNELLTHVRQLNGGHFGWRSRFFDEPVWPTLSVMAEGERILQLARQHRDTWWEEKMPPEALQIRRKHTPFSDSQIRDISGGVDL